MGWQTPLKLPHFRAGKPCIRGMRATAGTIVTLVAGDPTRGPGGEERSFPMPLSPSSGQVAHGGSTSPPTTSGLAGAKTPGCQARDPKETRMASHRAAKQACGLAMAEGRCLGQIAVFPVTEALAALFFTDTPIR